MTKTLITLILTLAVWGNIVSYTDHEITVSEIITDSETYKHEKDNNGTDNVKSYHLSKDVIIDTYSLEEDEKGNVRIELNSGGLAEEVYFYGIDMPDVIRKFKKSR